MSLAGVHHLLAGPQRDVDALQVIIIAEQQGLQVDLLPPQDRDELIHALGGQEDLQRVALWLVVIVQAQLDLVPRQLVSVMLLKAAGAADAVLANAGRAPEPTAQANVGRRRRRLLQAHQAALVAGADVEQAAADVVATEHHGAEAGPVEERVVP